MGQGFFSRRQKPAQNRLFIIASERRLEKSKEHKKKRQFSFGELPFLFGGDGEDRTLDLCVANAALSQLSYAPIKEEIKGL